MTTKRNRKLVRLVPVFGSPVWLPQDQARRQLAHEDGVYLRGTAVGLTLTFPRIERSH